ncbi:MAG: MBOAT family O-acyltransferase [Bacteroidales bacterium]|nr:MBOAT family O-acyltransferase [Bacteroidales bacterium]
MLFNSVTFAIFLTVVFLVYWGLLGHRRRSQNIFLLIASYFFYAWWDWRFLLLLIGISLFNYIWGRQIERTGPGKNAKKWLVSGLIVNIGVLVVFKYFNFFIDSLIDLAGLMAYSLPESSLRIILPLGISFYTFLSISYLLDIRKQKLSGNQDIINTLLSLSFFPIILAGPIQRPVTLIPQIKNNREFSYAMVSDGLRQLLWGLFVKVVIADNLAFYADEIFGNHTEYTGSTLLLGAIFYSVQIYADFSAYSDMAIGTGKMMGFRLMRNFAYPYFSRDITQFWKRWHISLTTWFRDYVFLPVSFSVSYKIRKPRVLFIKTDMFIYIVASTVTWFLTGLWHGASYNFIIWGMIHGVFLIIYFIQKKPRKRLLKRHAVSNNSLPIVVAETFITLFVVLIAWVFFRAVDVEHAASYLSVMFSDSLFTIPEFPFMKMALVIVIISLLFFFVEYLGRNDEYPLAGMRNRFALVPRWIIYYFIGMMIFFFAGGGQKFIYFQF